MKRILSLIIPVVILSAFGFFGCNENNNMITPEEGIPMQFVGNYSTSGNCMNSFTKNLAGNDYAFLSLDTSGIEIININSPSAPQFVAGYNISGSVQEVFVTYKNNVTYLFAAAGTGGLKVLDISNFSTPILDTTVSFTGDFINTVFADEYHNVLYLGSTNNKVYIFDINNLPNVVNISTYQSFSSINEIQVANNIAYVAQDGGIDIVNVSNPHLPLRITQGNSNDYAYDVKILGTLAVIANNENGVLLLDVTNPSNPQQLGFLDTYDIGLACSINGNLVYVAEDAGGVEVFDISNPSNPLYVAYYTTDSFSENIQYFKGNVFVSNYNNLLVVRYP